ncbi:hypothetical protein [Streptomyces sp. NPDC018045]|uniref:hypothetical protein n=1 Tax=Streptomyces sp. NPDC018045 TaxID=3365037 RepID=UPI00379A32F7
MCAAFVFVPLILLHPTLPLGWDEIVYASRFAPYAHGLDVPFEAPRTRGVPALIAPVAAWSDSVVLLRVWLSLLAGAALYGGFRPWLRGFATRPAVVPLAAGAYGSLWFALFYAPSAMPNHYTAMGATAAVGCFTRCAGGERRKRLLYGLALALATATLMRPNDAVWIVGPLLLALLLHRPWRALAPAAAIAVGVAAAALPWVIESVVRFGGIGARLALATDQQGGMHPQVNLAAVATSLDGPLLCRPCAGDSFSLPASLWWCALPLLVGAGLMVAHRSLPGQRAALWLATAVATSSALTYVFLIDYAAPRFLLTSYALLMLPAAVALHALWRAARTHSRLGVAALAIALCAHLAVQLAILNGHATIQTAARQDWTRITAALRTAGIGSNCVIGGNSSVIPIAYTAHCHPAAQHPHRTPDALVLRGTATPPPQQNWRVVPVPGTYNDWHIAVPATASARPGPEPSTSPSTAAVDALVAARQGAD